MNNEGYTAYPREKEMLLSEGCGVWVLNVERDVVVENMRESFEDFVGKAITIIHLIVTDV